MCPPRLVAIVALAVLVRLAFAAGYQGQDDKHYILNAATLALNGRVPIEVSNLWVTRTGHWLPIAASFRLFGFNEWVACFYVFACSVASVPLVFLTGRVFVGERAALLAAFLAAIFPLDACYATTAFVDLPVAFFMLLALHHVIVGQRRGSTGRFLLAGLATGWAYLCRESTVLILIPFGVYFLRRRSWPQLRAFTAGFLLLFAAECLFWNSVADDPLHRHRQALDRLEQIIISHGSSPEINPSDALGGWLPRPESGSMRRSSNSVIDFALMFATNEEFGLIAPLAWLLILYRIVRRQTDLWELVVWIVTLALLHGFVPFRFPYTLPRDPRYYASLTGPMVIVIAYHAVKWPARVRWLTVSVLVMTSFMGLLVTQPSRSVRVERRFAELLPRYGDREVYISPELNSFLTVYSGVPRPTGVTIHLLEEGPRSDSWRSLRALWPEAPFVESVAEIRRGYVAFYGVLSPARMPKGWHHLAVVSTPESRMVSHAIGALQAVGAPQLLLRRLLPGQGRSIHVYAVE